MQHHSQNGRPLPNISDTESDMAIGAKVEAMELESGIASGYATPTLPDENSSEDERKKVLRKLDLRIPPVLMMLYLLSYMDRANIGNANIEGMSRDLKLTGDQYNVVLSAFFATYIVFEIPSNFIMEKYFTFRPSWWLGLITAGWGIMMTMHGIVHNYGGLLTVRLLMGVFESGFFAGAIAYMTKWYTKYELATRLSYFYVGSALAGAFSGLLAYALAKMNGVGGLEGWRWIFIIEGIFTVLVGVVLPWILSDTPDNRPRWLSRQQADYLISRMAAENSGETAVSAGKHLNRSILWTVVTDWQYYPFVFVLWSNTVPTIGLKFTLPQIVKNMGYSSSNAQLLSIPPYVAGAVSSVSFNLLSDKFRRRSYFIVVPQTLLVIAYSILTALAPRSASYVGACYFAIVLACIGCYPINPGASSWCSNNTAPSAKRSIGIAYLISLSNIGGIFSSYIYIPSEAPGYPTGFGTSLAFAAAGIVAVVVLDVAYHRINKQRSKISEAEIREKYSDEELASMGDRSPLFRYTL